MIAPLGPVYQAGTLSGNPLAMRAGLATLPKLEEPFLPIAQPKNRAPGRRPANRAAASGDPAQVNATGSLLTIFFTADPVCDYARAKSRIQRVSPLFSREMLGRGVLLPPSQFEALFVSAAHTDEDIERTVLAAKSSLTSISRAQ